MKTVTHLLFRTLHRARYLLALVLSSLMFACGGGAGVDLVSASGVGSGGSGLASGTISGFGSIFVDGVEIEDALAYNLVENADGSTSNTQLKLGQRVEVLSTSSGTATQVTVRAAVVGNVASISTAAGTLRVAGQTVTINSNSAAGPLTVFGGGYLSLANVAVNDLVEVHGIATPATTGYTLMATRIEKLSTTASARVLGTVSGLNATNKSFAINGLTVNYASATVVPATATVANDQTVQVWGSLSSGTNPTLTATRVRVFTNGLGTTTTAISRVQASGVVSGYDATAGSFTVQGLTVLRGTTSVLPTGAVLANGVYVRVAGTLNTNGTVAATEIQVRQNDVTDTTAQVQLKGAISSLQNTTSFVVRNVPVDASAINLATSCPGVQLAAGTLVEVTARLQSGTDVVKATALRCNSSSTAGSFVQRQLRGTATNVVSASSAFTLALSNNTTQAVKWNDQTTFQGVTISTLAGTQIQVEGYLDASSVLVAREIRVPGQREADRFDNQGGGDWDRYDKEFRPAKRGNQN